MRPLSEWILDSKRLGLGKDTQQTLKQSDNLRTLICLHGFPGSGNEWGDLINEIDPGRKVVAPDMPWIADTKNRVHVENENFAAIIKAYAEFIVRQSSQPVHLFGHDLGGAFAWWIAALVPDIVHSLTISAAPHPTVYRNALVELEQDGRRDYFTKFLAENDSAPLPVASLLDRLEQDDETKSRLKQSLARTSAEKIRRLYRPFLSIDAVLSAPPFPDLKMPVCIVYGDQDKFFPADLFQKSGEQAGPDTRLVQMQTKSHYTHLSHPHQLAKRLEGFWKETESGGTQ